MKERLDDTAKSLVLKSKAELKYYEQMQEVPFSLPFSLPSPLLTPH